MHLHVLAYLNSNIFKYSIFDYKTEYAVFEKNTYVSICLGLISTYVCLICSISTKIQSKIAHPIFTYLNKTFVLICRILIVTYVLFICSHSTKIHSKITYPNFTYLNKTFVTYLNKTFVLICLILISTMFFLLILITTCVFFKYVRIVYVIDVAFIPP